jgi:molecular chaperone GrpE
VPDNETLTRETDQALAENSASGEPTSEHERLQAELVAAKDRELRALAEIENTRRRVRRDLDEQLKYANLALLRDLLPVLDNVSRAIEAAEKGSDADKLLEGVRLVATQLESVLAKHHCKRIEAVGQPFDPNLHEAIFQQPSAEHPPGTVTVEALPGFVLYDRVVRPTQVIVSAAGEASKK